MYLSGGSFRRILLLWLLNYCFHAFGATIADFDAVSVKYHVEAVIFANFCAYIFTERGIKSDYTSFVVRFVVNICVNRVVLYFLLVARLVQFIFIEGGLIH